MKAIWFFYLAPLSGLGIGLPGGFLVQPVLQDEPRRSRGALGPSLAENLSKTDPKIPGQTAFRLAEDLRYEVCAKLHQLACMAANRVDVS